MTDLKVCTKCGELKTLADFHANKTKRDGRSSACRTCESLRDKSYGNRKTGWRKRNPEKAAALQRKCFANWMSTEKGMNKHKVEVEKMTKSYVASLLKFRSADVPSEILSLKRDQLQIMRMARLLKKSIKGEI